MLLDSKKIEVVFAACGVLINVMADPQHREVMEKNKGIGK